MFGFDWDRSGPRWLSWRTGIPLELIGLMTHEFLFVLVYCYALVVYETMIPHLLHILGRSETKQSVGHA